MKISVCQGITVHLHNTNREISHLLNGEPHYSEDWQQQTLEGNESDGTGFPSLLLKVN